MIDKMPKLNIVQLSRYIQFLYISSAFRFDESIAKNSAISLNQQIFVCVIRAEEALCVNHIVIIEPFKNFLRSSL